MGGLALRSRLIVRSLALMLYINISLMEISCFEVTGSVCVSEMLHSNSRPYPLNHGGDFVSCQSQLAHMIGLTFLLNKVYLRFLLPCPTPNWHTPCRLAVEKT